MQLVGRKARLFLLAFGLAMLAACIAAYTVRLSAVESGASVEKKLNLCDREEDIETSLGPAELTALPNSTILTRPDIGFFSQEATPNRFELGFLRNGKHLSSRAQVMLEPQTGELVIKLMRTDCAIDIKSPSNSTVLTLEHLYGVVIASGVWTKFQIALCNSDGACTNRLKSGASQYAALRAIALLRQEIASTQQPSGGYKHWALHEIKSMRSNHDTVSARIENKSTPVQGQVVAFSRAPHMGCFATTDTTGLATCDLEDYHGNDGHDHHGHETNQFTVTLTGGTWVNAVVPPLSRSFPESQR